MNKNKLFKVFVMIAFIMCSCEDNFDPKMYGTLNVSNYPVTEAEYESFMMTCYMPFTTTWTYWIGAGTSGNQHGWYIPAGGVLKFFDYPTDEVAVWNNGWGGGYYFLSKADFSQCVYYASGTLSDENPNHFPKVSEISYFTNVIGTLEKASTEVVSEERKREFIAEARLCRGLMMYYLLHVYGPVPLIVDPNDLINPSKLENLVRPTLQQMTEWIMADFDYAYQYIADTQPEQGRYNKDYARVCIMRHCLNEGYYMSGYYQKAIDMYNELKGRYSLFKKGDNPYIEQFKNANNFNSEVIMAVSCDETADGTNKSGNFNPLMMLATPDNAARVDDQGNPTPFYLQGQGWGQTFNVSPKFWDTYDPSDKRREVILTKYYTTAGIVIMQLETPIESVTYAAKMAKKDGITAILNPAPAPTQQLPDDLLANVDILIPNVTEAEIISGMHITDDESAKEAIRYISSKGIKTVIITMGAKGALAYENNEFIHIPAFKVEAVDTTAAGDTFCGGLCVALSEGKNLKDAIIFASKASSISVTRMGAQVSIPLRKEIQ